MTGDIYEIAQHTYGIVITPECDISHIRKTEGCEFELLTFTASEFPEYLKKDFNVNARVDYAGYDWCLNRVQSPGSRSE